MRRLFGIQFPKLLSCHTNYVTKVTLLDKLLCIWNTSQLTVGEHVLIYSLYLSCWIKAISFLLSPQQEFLFLSFWFGCLVFIKALQLPVCEVTLPSFIYLGSFFITNCHRLSSRKAVLHMNIKCQYIIYVIHVIYSMCVINTRDGNWKRWGKMQFAIFK